LRHVDIVTFDDMIAHIEGVASERDSMQPAGIGEGGIL